MAIDLDHETNTVGTSEGTGTLKLQSQTEAQDSFIVRSTDVVAKPSLTVIDGQDVERNRLQITHNSAASWYNPGGGASARQIYSYYHLRMHLIMTQFLHAAGARAMTLPESGATGYIAGDDAAWNAHAKLRYNTDTKDTELQLPRATDPTNFTARYPLAWRIALTTAQRQAMNAGDLRVGQEVYDTTRNRVYVWNGTRWRLLGSDHPGYQSARWYSAYDGNTAGGGQGSNTLYVYPYFIKEPTAVSGFAWDMAVAGTGFMKGAIYANDPAINRPTGLPLVASNVAVDRAASPCPSETFTASAVLEPDIYWFATMIDASPTGQTICANVSWSGHAASIGSFTPENVFNPCFISFQRSVTYASSDMRTVDNTGAGWTANNSGSCPVMAFQAA